MKRKLSTVEAAKEIGVSRQSLQMWLSRGLVHAPEITVGGATVRMWSVVDIRRALKFKGSLRPGPKGPRGK